MFNLNPKKMQAMMKQLGIKQEEIDAERVIIECKEKNITIEEPSVTKINMQGQETFQIIGNIKEVSKGTSEEETTEIENTEKDIKTIIEKTSCTEKQAKEALEEADGDLAEAILNLNQR